MNEYSMDTTVRLSVQFTRQDNGLAFDPIDVQLYLLAPSAAIEEHTYSSNALQRDDVGLYHFDTLVGVPGRWRYGFIGTGQVEVSTGDIIFQVLPSKLFGRQLPATAQIKGSGGATA